MKLPWLWGLFFGSLLLGGPMAGQPPNRFELPFRPNILWLVAEDLSPVIPPFGDSTVQTPNLSRLAAEGVCYDRFFSPAPVCAPARAAIATGKYPVTIGANHMRTGPWFAPDLPDSILQRFRRYWPPGIPLYEAVPPPEVRMMSELLRAAGYYCTNNAKEDYQFRRTLTAWDESSNRAHWRKRPPGKPFFAVFNFGVTHESQIWAKQNDSLLVPPELPVPVPPYLPDTEVGRRDVRRMYSNVVEMDAQVGEILRQLEADGLLDSTVIFWYTDHGGPLPRQKRMLYDSGIRVPLIVRFPGGRWGGLRDGRLLSFIDLAPTVLSLAGLKPPDWMDGRSFLGPYATRQERRYLFAAADRFDETTDHVRAVRDSRFKYIRYLEPDKPMFLHVQYRDQMPIMQELYRLRDKGRLSYEQALWFRSRKPPEELFDTQTDPHELHNLAEDPRYRAKLLELRRALDDWLQTHEDLCLLPEKELLKRFWPEGRQPQTAAPRLTQTQNRIALECPTEGASIGYQIFPAGEAPPASWEVYTRPFRLGEGFELRVVAHRLGYLRSPVFRLENGSLRPE